MPLGLREIERAGLRLVELSAHEGRCLAAAPPGGLGPGGKGFRAGSILITETPLVRDSVKELAAAMARDPSRFDLLRGSENLAASEVKDEDAKQPFLLQAETNSFIFRGRVVGFNAFSMLNHACASSVEENVCFSILNTGDRPIDDTLEVKLVATRDIKAGEALRISYHELFAEPAARAERIRAHCGGSCGCSRCALEAADAALAAAGLQLGFVAEEPAACQGCGLQGAGSQVAPQPVRRPVQGELVEICGPRASDLLGAIGVVREMRSNGCSSVETLHQAIKTSRTIPLGLARPLQSSAERGGLQKCSACKSIYFCSRECQREGWKAHKPFCVARGASTASSWQDERAALLKYRNRFDRPEARQAASEAELLEAFESFERFVTKWVQLGRAPRLASGHQAIQEALLLALPLGSMILWRMASTGKSAQNAQSLLDRVSRLARLHLRHVRLLVPHFHIAHWTALHYAQGILLAKGLLGKEGQSPAATALAEDFGKCLDVADVFDPEAASTFRASASSGPSGKDPLADGSKLFQLMAQDPSKLAEFYSIDPELPLDQKMERMARLLDPAVSIPGKPSKPAVSTRPQSINEQERPLRMPGSTARSSAVLIEEVPEVQAGAAGSEVKRSQSVKEEKPAKIEPSPSSHAVEDSALDSMD